MLIKNAILAVNNIKWTKHCDIPDEIMERNLPKEYSWEIKEDYKIDTEEDIDCLIMNALWSLYGKSYGCGLEDFDWEWRNLILAE